MAAFKRDIVVSWIAFAVAVAATSLVMALVVRFQAMGGASHLLGPGDQSPVFSGLFSGSSFSSYFCQEMDISADQSSGAVVFNAYALSSEPTRSGQSRRDTVRLDTAVDPSTGVSQPFAFNLHGGRGPASWLQMHACSSRTALGLYRCQDEASAMAWRSAGDNRRCNPLCLYTRCGEGTENYCSLLANQDVSVDEFVFVLEVMATGSGQTVTGVRDDSVRVDASVTRHPYDLRVHSALCLNVSECRLPISLGETRAVVLEIPAGVTSGSIVLTTKCRPRIGIYFAFYLGAPLAVVLAGSLLVFLPCLLLQSSLKRPSFELQVKGFGRPSRSALEDHDGAGLVDNDYLGSEN